MYLEVRLLCSNCVCQFNSDCAWQLNQVVFVNFISLAFPPGSSGEQNVTTMDSAQSFPRAGHSKTNAHTQKEVAQARLDLTPPAALPCSSGGQIVTAMDSALARLQRRAAAEEVQAFEDA